MPKREHRTADADAVCPFFHEHFPSGKIVCEGIVQGTVDTIFFDPPRTKKAYYELFCCQLYKQCVRHKALMTKYEEGKTL